MVGFHRFKNRGIQIARVNSILITKSIYLQWFTLILYGVVGQLWSKAIFRAQSIYREVYMYWHLGDRRSLLPSTHIYFTHVYSTFFGHNNNNYHFVIVQH